LDWRWTMTTEFRDAVRAALAAVSVSDDYDLSWFGEIVETIRPLPDESMMREAAAAFLSRLLYRGFYLFGWPRRELSAFQESVMEGLSPTRSARFIDAVVQAAGVGAVTISRPMGSFRGAPAIELDGAKVPIAHAGFRENLCSVRLPTVSLTKSPGFVLFRSPAGQPGDDGQRLVRLYWNVTAAGAVELIPLLIRSLDERALSYQFKVVHSDAVWPERADTGVLYLGHRDLVNVWPALREVHTQVLPLMRPYVPALTYKMALGLGVAEEPGDGTSHGMAVCSMVADGIIRAHADACTDPAARLEYVAESFAQRGRTLDRPYAGAEMQPVIDALATGSTAPSVAGVAVPSGDVFLAHADRIARRIADAALWNGDRCTWLQPQLDADRHAGWGPMGADLYSGTAGMALFFAQIARVTGESAYIDLAKAAARQTLAAAAALPGVGLYSGTTGAGLAIALTGHALGEPTLVTQGCELVRTSAKQALAAEGSLSFDVIDGVAGALIALLATHPFTEGGDLDLAESLGALLVRMARAVTPDTLCWFDPIRKDRLAFIGFAHGAAGCAFALGELGRILSDSAYLQAAEQACRYERGWYDEATGNWRDVRALQERSPDADTAVERDLYRFDWCYGAPGLALSRIPLVEATVASADVIEDAHRGFGKARQAAKCFPALVYDTCLCHGSAGIAEILSLAPQEFANGEHDRLARVLTWQALKSYRDDLVWSSGYGLMLGAAGVALAALRRADDSIVSPLLVLPYRYRSAASHGR